MKSFYKKLFPAFMSAVLGILGFSSCKGGLGLFERDDVEVGDIGDMRAAYGTPTGEFKVDINVTDEQGKPIKGIKVVPVVLHAPNYDIVRSVLDPIVTNDTGKASNIYDFWWVSDDVNVIFEDIDGKLNGGYFAKDSMSVKPVKTKEGQGWYVGEYTVTGTKTLKQK